MSELPPSAKDHAIATAFLANKWYDVAHGEGTLIERSEAAGQFNMLQNMAALALRPSVEDLMAMQSQEVDADELRHWSLTRPIGKLVEETREGTLHSHVTVIAIEKVFARENFLNLREALVAGSERVYNLQGFGPTCGSLLRRAIHKVDPALEWPERPDPALAADLYEDLKHIPAHAIDPDIRSLIGIQSVPGVLKVSRIAIERAIIDKLASGEIDQNRWIQQHRGMSPGKIAEKIQAGIRNFAQEFVRLKASAHRK
ncbi:MAG TPA: hypothetical protein VLG11_05960 [Candidatus Saccharimonadales bacterium]|nr:hypothetical protein [Candidatus Saccharimonadales bacterium]